MSTDPADEAHTAAAPLAMWERATCAVIGVAGATAGVVAVFVSENSVGTGVLLAIGAFFLLIDTTGLPVERAKLGDSEIQFARRLKRTVAATLDAATDDIKPQLAEAILDAAPPEGDALSRQAQAVLFEQSVYRAIEAILAEQGHRGAWQFVPHAFDHGFDAYLHRAEGQTIKVVVKHTSRPAPSAALAQVKGMEGDFLFVSSSGFTSETQHRASDFSDGRRRISLVKWASEDDSDKLRSALADLIERHE